MAQVPVRRQSQQDVLFNPFAELEKLQREMNRLFDFSLSRYGTDETGWARGAWIPAVDIIETNDAYVVKADLPGLSKDDLDVSVQDNILTIKGEKKQEKEIKEEDYIRQERYYGTFQRALTLPAQTDPEKIQARFKDGVLEITIPKKEEAKPKQIKVDVG